MERSVLGGGAGRIVLGGIFNKVCTKITMAQRSGRRREATVLGAPSWSTLKICMCFKQKVLSNARRALESSRLEFPNNGRKLMNVILHVCAWEF